MLSSRLDASTADDSVASTVAVSVSPQALPLFHWLGVEPSARPEERSAPSAERSPVRRRFFGRRP